MEEGGDLWFGSTAGVARYSNGSFVNLRNELPDNEVRAICEDSSGCLWFVMGNGSIWRYDRKNFVRCIKGDGLSSNNYVMGDICEDSKGNLWFGTKNGVSTYFLKKYSKSMKKSINGFNPEAMRLLMDYAWPGNVRELENEIKRAVALVDDKEIITPEMLSDRIKGVVSELQLDDEENIPLKDMMKKVERRLLLKALKRNNRNVTKTAEKLGISRVTLQKKIKKCLK